MKHLALIAISTLLAACGTGREPAASEAKSVMPADTEYVFACSADESFAATLQSIRVGVRNGGASLVIDRYSSSDTYAAADSRISVVNDATVSIAWAGGPEFSVTREKGRVFAGQLTLTGETIPVRCVRIVTSDRDADEFSLYCAPAAPGAAGAAEIPAVPRELLLTYEEGELEMFVNPTSALEIFDLELASGVEVNAGLVRGTWAFHATSFRAEATGPATFSGVLDYRGLSTHRFVCHKI